MEKRGYGVLVVDDEAAICRGLLKLIDWESLGFTRRTFCENGMDALRLAACERFDLLITDIRMPEIDGLELIERMRDAGLCRNFLILSAYAEFDYARTALRCGARDYLLKPVNGDLLYAIALRVSEELRNESLAQEAFESLIVTEELPPPEECAELPDGQPAGVPPKNRRKIVADMLRYTEEHYSEDITLTQMSHIFFMNPVYLGRLFKASVGESFTEHLNTCRIQKAIGLLRKDECMVYEVCEAVGYRDLNYFYKLFRKKTGMTPTEFRNSQNL